MAKKFHFILNSPESSIFDHEVESVSLPTSNGEIGIMADHTPLIALISPGVIGVTESGKTSLLATGGGFVEVKSNEVKAFVQSAEFADSIDEQRAIEAAKQAKQDMAAVGDEISLADASSILERNIARLKTIERKKRHGH